MTAETRETLCNREVIAVERDPALKQGARIAIDGSKAVGQFHGGRSAMNMTVRFAALGFPGAVTVRDAFVPKLGVAMLRLAAAEK